MLPHAQGLAEGGAGVDAIRDPVSPCVLPLVPIYLATLAGSSATALREGSRGKRLFAATLAFSLGLSIVFITLGLAASAVGRTLSGHRALVLQLSGL